MGIQKLSQLYHKEVSSILEQFGKIKKDTINSKSQSFTLQLMLGLTYTNKDYFRFGYKDSPQCKFCGEEVQSFSHLFIHCNATKAIWKRTLVEILGDNKFPSEYEMIMGYGSQTKRYILKELQRYTYS